MGIVVKHSYIDTKVKPKPRAHAHLKYLQFRSGEDITDNRRRSFFNATGNVHSTVAHEAIDRQTDRYVAIHKLLVAFETSNVDRPAFVRALMHQFCQQKNWNLEWYAVCHNNTDDPHVHMVIMPTDLRRRRIRFSVDDYHLLRKIGSDLLISDTNPNNKL
ncbi:MAG: hypothetical protein K2Y22_02315 [Candidatus Obscuribacterales bacterium]|nr:hypothetical protein [Candidatus Obscuribacterales bacterium]